MRKYLKFIFLSLILITCFFYAGYDFEPANFDDLLHEHPRLLLTEERIDELRIQIENDQFSHEYFTHMVSWADSLMGVPLLKREITGRRMLSISRRLLEKVAVLGMVGKISGEQSYKKAAIKQLRQVAEFEDWNPSHFLDTAEMTAGVALGYDWFYDELSKDDRELLSGAIIHKGLKPSFIYDEWATRTNNWNSVGHGGMVLGALVVADIEPDFANKILKRANENVSRVKSSYAPDGAYKEGPMYWAYGTVYVTIYLSALKSALNLEYDLDQIPGFLESADYMHQVVGPTGLYFNYGDNYSERVFTPALFWFGKYTGRNDLTEFNKNLVTNYTSSNGYSKPLYLRGGSRFAPFALIWYDPLMTEGAVDKPLFWKGNGEMPIAVMRSSWEDSNAAYIGIKGGSSYVSHAHMDVGSFVIEAGGVRWAIDLGPQDYHSLETADLHIWNYRQNSDRWKVFRLGPESHNIPRFNDKLPITNGFAPIEKINNPNAIGEVKIDLSEVYSSSVEQMYRRARLNMDESVVIHDKWIPHRNNGDNFYTWQLITSSAISMVADGFILTKDGVSMNVTIETEYNDYKIKTEKVNKLLSEFDTPNPGISRIRIISEHANQDESEIKVTFKLADE